MLLTLAQFLFGPHLTATLIAIAFLAGIAFGLALGYFAGRQRGYWAGRNKQIDLEAATWRSHRKSLQSK